MAVPPRNPLTHANIPWLNRSKVEMSKRISAQKGYVYTLDRDGRFWETTHFLVDIIQFTSKLDKH